MLLHHLRQDVKVHALFPLDLNLNLLNPRVEVVVVHHLEVQGE